VTPRWHNPVERIRLLHFGGSTNSKRRLDVAGLNVELSPPVRVATVTDVVEQNTALDDRTRPPVEAINPRE
jgi:hypothetical protein